MKAPSTLQKSYHPRHSSYSPNEMTETLSAIRANMESDRSDPWKKPARSLSGATITANNSTTANSIRTDRQTITANRYSLPRDIEAQTPGRQRKGPKYPCGCSHKNHREVKVTLVFISLCLLFLYSTLYYATTQINHDEEKKKPRMKAVYYVASWLGGMISSTSVAYVLTVMYQHILEMKEFNGHLFNFFYILLWIPLMIPGMHLGVLVPS